MLWLVAFGPLEAEFASLIRVQLSVQAPPKKNSSPIRKTCYSKHGFTEQSDRLEGLVMYRGGGIRSEADKSRILGCFNAPTLGQVCDSQAPGVYILNCSSILMIKWASPREAHRGFPVTRPSPLRSLRDDSDTWEELRCETNDVTWPGGWSDKMFKMHVFYINTILILPIIKPDTWKSIIGGDISLRLPSSPKTPPVNTLQMINYSTALC